MADVNLLSPFGYNKLQYPHYTKWDDKAGLVHIVSTSDALVKEGDNIFVGFNEKTPDGEKMTYIRKPRIVQSIKEQRRAKGDHNVNAIFQLVSIL